MFIALLPSNYRSRIFHSKHFIMDFCCLGGLRSREYIIPKFWKERFVMVFGQLLHFSAPEYYQVSTVIIKWYQPVMEMDPSDRLRYRIKSRKFHMNTQSELCIPVLPRGFLIYPFITLRF